MHKCLFCGEDVCSLGISAHKKNHAGVAVYGCMWPYNTNEDLNRNLSKVPMYESAFLAHALNVRKVYIRDEGQNFSGSMKDYSTERAVRLGTETGVEIFTVVSSGNQAVSLAKYTALAGKKAIMFTPASSSKINMLSTFSNVLVIAVADAIFEDVYRLAANLELDGVYNANVSNELLLPGFMTVSKEIFDFAPDVDCIFSGVGNGSYLAGIILGYQNYRLPLPKIIPVGMDGAFPTKIALENGFHIYEYNDFLTEESLINAAEGSIAIASYSMPQLVYAVSVSHGFGLGDLLNTDLAAAYNLLYEDDMLLACGVIPEPTGIMGLAAALKHKDNFGPESCLLISFTGHGVKDLDGIKRLVPNISNDLCRIALTNRPDLASPTTLADQSRIRLVDQSISQAQLQSMIEDWVGEELV